MSRPGYDRPPSEWAGARAAGDDVYWVADPAGGIASVLTWHWCTGVAPGDGPVVEAGRWAASNVGKHTLLVADPLHIEPSVLWDCCGKHGYLRGGRWTEV